MTRNLRMICLAVGAVLAVSAISASSAMAESEFTCAEGGVHVHCILKGTTEAGMIETFTNAAGAKLECHNSYEATSLTGTETGVNGLTVKYLGSKWPAGSGAGVETVKEGCVATLLGAEFATDISFRTCDYQFTISKKLAAGEYTGTVDVKCNTPGDYIEIKVTTSTGATKCVNKIFAQNGLSHVIYKNKVGASGKEDVTVEATVSKANGKGITYTSEGGILNCGESAGEKVEGATYSGNATVEAVNTENQPVDATVAGE